MVKYKVNLKFKENGKSLNETITNVLKIELNRVSDIPKTNLTSEKIYYSKIKEDTAK